MSYLDGAEAPNDEPLIITICGTPGTGKTTTAASFPKPIFLISTLGEKLPKDLDRDDIRSLGETSTEDHLFKQLIALTQDDHPYRTVIIDSVTGLESLFTEEVMKLDPKAKSIQTCMGGYGAGRDAVAIKHGRVRKAAEFLRRKGINVVFLAHSDVSRIDPPDSDGYTQYSLRLHSKSMSPYVDSVDLVGFIKQETAVIGEEGKRRAIGSGERVLVTYLTPTAITKNRLGITSDIPLEKGVNPLAQYMGGQLVEADEGEKPSRRRRKPEMEPDVVEEEIEVAEEGEVE